MDAPPLDDAPKLVMYYVTWCPIARKTVPEFDKVQQLLLGTQISFHKINAEDSPDLASAAGVDSFPTIILYKAGQKITYGGELSAEAMKRFVELS